MKNQGMGRRFGRFGGWVVIVWTSLGQLLWAQTQCADRLSFTPVSQPNRIEWSKFPDFTLPFPVIYGGPRLGDAQGSPLRHGFSQIVYVQDSEYGSVVQPQQRAIEYSGFATGLNQPWETIESPWANDLTAYRAKWERFLSDVSGGRKNAAGQYIIPANRLVIDVERIAETDARILRLKQDTRVPANYRNLSDAEFVAAYKKAIRNLYAEGARYIRQRSDLTGVNISSYADTPILNNYLNITTFSWSDWTTNLSRVNYLVKDSTERMVGGPFYEQLDALSPSAYYYYDYPNPLAQDYLAYMLFQVEVNRAWSNKPVVPWVWLRYHNSTNNYPNFIQPFMAEATAIFPIFSGASGIWLWDEPGLEQRATGASATVFTAYESFIHGLYRLSRFSDMFQGSYERVIETPARDLMEKQQPVWRGIVKGNNILIAAQNPYANDGQKTSLTVRYKNWQRAIELTGREVYLCRFDMGTVTAGEPLFADVNVYPNPARTTLTVSFGNLPASPTDLQLLNISGRTVVKKQVSRADESLNVTNLPAGVYVLRISNQAGSHTRKVLIGTP